MTEIEVILIITAIPNNKKVTEIDNFILNLLMILFSAKEKLNIVEYSFSQTTLEQVFLKFAQTENVESSDQDK